MGNILDPPIVARFVRVHFVEILKGGYLRMELYGCYESELLLCCYTVLIKFTTYVTVYVEYTTTILRRNCEKTCEQDRNGTEMDTRT